MKHRNIFRIMSALLIVVLVASAMSLSALAVNLPDINRVTLKGYPCAVTDVANKRLHVFREADLQSRDPNEWIDVVNDEVTILGYDSQHDSVLVRYPLGNKKFKERYVPAIALFGVRNAKTRTVISTRKFTTYKDMALKRSYGYVAPGDLCYVVTTPVGSYGNYRIFYEVPSGYKLAFLSAKDGRALLSDSSQPSASSSSEARKIGVRLQTMAAGTSDGGIYKVGIRYTGKFSEEQCKGFAKRIHEVLFGYNIGSTRDKPNNYQIRIDETRSHLVGTLTAVPTRSDAALCSLFNATRPGDFLQVRRNHSGSHSMIFLASDANGVTVFEANVDGRNTIQRATYTWNEFRAANAAVSVYSANDYRLQ